MRHVNIDLEDITVPMSTPLNSQPRKTGIKPGLRNHLKPAVEYFQEYSQVTSIHGLQFLGENNRPLKERVWWGVALVLCLSTCGYLIMDLVKKWHDSPVIVTFAEKPMSISDIPFPAVSFCMLPTVDRRRFDIAEVLSRWPNVTDREYRILVGLQSLEGCTPTLSAKNENATEEEKEFSSQEITPDDLMLVREVLLQCSDLITKCEFNGLNETCEQEFHPNFMHGYCCTFNMLSPPDTYTDHAANYCQEENCGSWPKVSGWDLMEGYVDGPEDDRGLYPLRQHVSGFSGHLYVQIEIDDASKQDAWCILDANFPSVGIRVHSPIDPTPDVGNYHYFLNNSYIMFRVKPSATSTLQNVHKYKPTDRHCFAAEERKLYFYKMYSERNCQYECLANASLELCGCVPAYLPGERSTRICNVGNDACSFGQFYYKEYKYLPRCNCLPSCTEINYESELQQFDYNYDFNENSTSAILLFYFKERNFIAKQRRELYSSTDFIANIGGILGLCLGFSVVSVIEILYFLTIRLCSKIGSPACSCNKIQPSEGENPFRFPAHWKK